ncbi:hypothetical protein ACN1C3_16945 [Pseudomonas sp. H11T01]|uniref:hypothetical protein n=1 Tax=Pseudomonas sp. H11T01 TaxID=3402749 RepID=UPI003AD4529D
MSQDLPQTCLPTQHPMLNVVNEEYCTVVFRLRRGRPAMGAFLLELSQHIERAGTVEIVRFQVGDDLGHPHA